MKLNMNKPILARIPFILASVIFYSSGLFAADETMHQQGLQDFNTYCASCHLGAMPEAPVVASLKLYPAARIVETLESGAMSTIGMALSNKQKHQIAFYLTGKKTVDNPAKAKLLTCKDQGITRPTLTASASWNGWGGQSSNVRHQKNESLLTTKNIHDLALKWAFAFPNATRVRSQPIVTPQMTFIGSQAGTIYALDTDTGCLHWDFQAIGEVRGAIYLHNDKSGSPRSLFFGDLKSNVYAIDAQTGRQLWQSKADSHPMAAITGSVMADLNNVYVPVSSLEIIAAAQPSYECCTFSGALVAFDIETGKQVWKTRTTETPKSTGKSSVGTNQYGPSGAPIWSGPTLDAKRALIYVTTGQNYSSPATDTSDSVLAINVKDGKIKWVTQVTKGDAWNGACMRKTANCPEEDGPDFDIGASAMLVADKAGKDWLIIGDKSGMVYALDPDNNGKILWQRRVGSGGTMGGVHWGMSTDGEKIYVGISDLPTNNRYSVGEPQPGLKALLLQTGELIWQYQPPFNCPKDGKFMCFNGISAAVSSSPGLVYAGSLDGMLHIVDAKKGEVLWQFNTKQDINTINGIKGFGGTIESDGPVIVNGELFITSGYDKWGEAPGNLLMVFSLPHNQSKTTHKN